MKILKKVNIINRFLTPNAKKAGQAPGTLTHTGPQKTTPVNIKLYDYDQNELHEEKIENIDRLKDFSNTEKVTWVNIDGIHNTGIVEKIGDIFSIHPLVLEDVLNTGQRPRFEDMDSFGFEVMKILYYDPVDESIQSEQISIIIAGNFVLTFLENPCRLFDTIRERIVQSRGKIRKMGPDYLAYSIIDLIVDQYFVVLEKLGEKIEGLESQLLDCPDRKTITEIHSLKRELLFLRKSIWPLREAINNMQKCESGFITDPTRPYLADIYDHTIQIIDTVETFRDIATGLMELYLSSLSNRTNDVMKTLTIIATIFIPLSFVAGVFGMNFKHMPELSQKWMYPAGFWLIIILILAVMLLYFRRKKWF
jgi:magnesium transporter